MFASLGADLHVGCRASAGSFQQMSFVNNIWTTRGGTHVSHVTAQIAAHLVEHVLPAVLGGELPTVAVGDEE